MSFSTILWILSSHWMLRSSAVFKAFLFSPICCSLFLPSHFRNKASFFILLMMFWNILLSIFASFCLSNVNWSSSSLIWTKLLISVAWTVPPWCFIWNCLIYFCIWWILNYVCLMPLESLSYSFLSDHKYFDISAFSSILTVDSTFFM